MRLLRALLLPTLITAFAGVPVHAKNGDDPDAPGSRHGTPRGLTTTLGTSFYSSSLAPASATDFEFYAGMGYNINPHLMIALKVLTGHEELDAAAIQPYSGRLDLGGGELELTYRFLDDGIFRPSVTGAYGLTTLLLGSSGYHGRFVQFGAGAELFVTDLISLQGKAWYRYRDFNHLITDGQFQQSSFDAIDRSIGVSVGCNLHFNIFP